ncbi:endothelial cell-specific chemotaxis regulator isoform X5 [Alligator mississippiensis]|uniref:Endothelial cell-specific chemotaxis regulator isoform C n=1 Tax=Alligator mississippiensis TaxID=8496 RepID=A0A151NR00_ALLMI|nr:endothelial cell-specific chemotaxis regulator isoform X5 [Alligator mississippiensis]KYO39204.1 endothelial cell-specific chemotaxis regulator isoform C [Alligator mississippiensis]
MPAPNFCVLFWISGCVLFQDVNTAQPSATQPPAGPKATGSGNITSSPTSVISEAHKEAISAENTMISPSAITPTEKSGLEIVAFGVIGFIGILVVVVFILVGVVYLRFRCNHSKDAEDKQKPEDPVVSESCSAATNRKNSSVTLISMKNINMNNSLSYPTSEKVL